jgi:hypothetical protein
MAFFVFSFLHCFTQGTIQSFLFSADDSYGALTSEIVARANITSTIFPQYTGRHGKYSLELCDQVPVLGGESHPCDPFFTVGQPGPVMIPSRALPSGFKNVSSVRQLFLETFDFSLTFVAFVQSSGLLGQSQNNVVGLYTSIVPIPSHLSPDLTSLGRQWPRFFPQHSDRLAAKARWAHERRRHFNRRNHVDHPRARLYIHPLVPAGQVSAGLSVSISVPFLTSPCRLSQARREELSLIGSQFWFFGLAVFAVSICATFLPLAIVEYFLQLIFESIPHMYMPSPLETTSMLTDGIASPLSLPVCSLPGGRPMLCGVR